MAVGGFSERLQFILELDPANAVAGMRRVGDAADKELGKTDDRINKLGGRMQAFGAGAVVAAGVAVRGLSSLAEASEEAAAQSRKLDQAMANNASFAAEGRESFDDLASSLQDLTGVDGDAVTGMLGFLGTLGQTADEAQRAAPLIVDLAKRFGLELEPAARLVNNAMDGNTARLERLIGPIGDAEGALGALSRTVGGFAAREGQTFSGQLEILKANLGDVAEGVGGGVVSAFNDLLGPVSDLTDKFTNLDPATQNAVGKLLAFGTAGVAVVGTAAFVAGSLLKLQNTFQATTTAMGLSSAATARLTSGLAVAGVAVAGFAASYALIEAANEKARAMGDALGVSAEQSVRASSSFAEFQATMGRVNDGIDELKSSADELDGPLHILDSDKQEQLREGQRELENLRDRYAGVGEEVEALAASEGISLDAAYRQVIGARDAAAAHEELVSTLGEEGAAASELADETENLAAITDGLADVAGDAADALGRLYGETLTGVEAASKHEAALDALQSSIRENGATLDLNTDAGRKNTGAAIDAADAIVDLIGIRLEETGSLEDAAFAGSLYVENLRDQLREAGLTEEQVAAYIDTLNLTPEDINTLIRQTGTETAAGFLRTYQAQLDALPEEERTAIIALVNQGAYAQAESALNQLARDRQMRVVANYVVSNGYSLSHLGGGSPNQYQSASGGYAGQGVGGASDTIPTLLTPGEFVIKKSAADKLGSAALNALNDGNLPAIGVPVGSAGGGGFVFAPQLTVNAGLGADGQGIADTIVDVLGAWLRGNGNFPWAT